MGSVYGSHSQRRRDLNSKSGTANVPLSEALEAPDWWQGKQYSTRIRVVYKKQQVTQVVLVRHLEEKMMEQTDTTPKDFAGTRGRCGGWQPDRRCFLCSSNNPTSCHYLWHYEMLHTAPLPAQSAITSNGIYSRETNPPQSVSDNLSEATPNVLCWNHALPVMCLSRAIRHRKLWSLWYIVMVSLW